MAVIKNPSTGKYLLLNAEHLFGRNPLLVNTVLSQDDVSKRHALVSWENSSWCLQDQSRNGTLVNGSHIHRSSTVLKKGDVIQFGIDESAIWEMVSDVPPSSYLQMVGNKEEVRALLQLPGIPQYNDSEISIFYSAEHSWKAEIMGNRLDLRHGSILRFEDEDWKFIANDKLDETRDYGKMVSAAYFQFSLSADEEQIQVHLVGTGWELNLETRVHHYLLLALARQMLAHVQEGFGTMDRGWIANETLCEDMTREFQKDIDEYALNLHIHRLRKQLRNLPPYGHLFSNVIERRKGGLRLFHPYFRILKEDACLGEHLPEAGAQSVLKRSRG